MQRLALALGIILLILLFETLSWQILTGEDEYRPAHRVKKTLSRKALVEVQDYDYGGYNPKHDPRRGKAGMGGRNF